MARELAIVGSIGLALGTLARYRPALEGEPSVIAIAILLFCAVVLVWGLQPAG